MSALLRVLVVEDSPDDAELMLRELSRGGPDLISKRVETAGEMRAALAEAPWDVVLSDHSLPGFGAGEALALCREADPDLPFLVVSGTIGEERAVEMMRAGARDYILKDSLARLAPAIERELLEAGNRRARRKAEQAASRLAAVVESSDDAIISKTLDGVITSWNPAAERLYGWAAEEAIGRHVSFIVPPDKADEFDGVLRRLLRSERVEPFETVRVRKGGTRVEVSTTASLVRDGDGRLIGISKIVRDVTAKKAAEEAMARDAMLLANVRDSVIVTDLDGIVTYWNEGATRLFGWTVREMLGRPLVERLPEEARPAALSAIAAVVAQGEWSGEWEDQPFQGDQNLL